MATVRAYKGPGDAGGLTPDYYQTLRMFKAWFGDVMRGHIDIGWTSPETGGIYQFRRFDCGDLETASEFAVTTNETAGQAVYWRPSAVITTAPLYVKDEHFLCAPGNWADLDEEEASKNAKNVTSMCRPTMAIITGRHPTTRVQLFWKHADLLTNPEQVRRINSAIRARVGGDPAVVNPTSLMRVAGTIAWPWKEGRIVELTQLVDQWPDNRPLAHPTEMVERSFPPVEEPRQERPYTVRDDTQEGGLHLDLGVKVDDYMAAIRAGRQWHNHLLGLIAHWISRGWSDSEILATAPSWTLAGYTVAQTVADMTKMIQGARAKWNIPDPEPIVEESGVAASEPDADVFSIADLKGEPKPREWLVEGWLPKRAVTILYGDGGTGKTLIAQQLGTCMRIGRPWLGLPVAQGNVFAVFCEDSRDEIHWRQHHINGHYGIALTSALTGFDAVSRFGHNNQIAVWDMKGNVQVTPFYSWLLEQVKERRPELLILDTAADMFAGNENSRVEVNHFLKAVVGRFVAEFGTTVLILAHPSLTGLTTGSGMGGSTAWNNAVRSRWSLVKPKDEDGDIRTLTKMKANYAAAGDDEKIELVWDDGVIDVPASAGALAKLEQKALKRKILIAIDEAWKAGKGIGGNQSNRPARTVLPGMVRDRPGKIMKALGGLITDGFVTQERQHNKRAYKVDSWPAWFGKADENDDA